LSTEDLPWAYPLQSVTSAGISGIGHSPVGPVEGSWVVIIFRDNDEQMPVMMGTIGGIPQQNPITFDRDDDSPILRDVDNNTLQKVPTEPSEQPVIVEDESEPQIEQGSKDLSTIPTTPPPEITANRQLVENNIRLLIAACQRANFTREQACSLLAIAGGESMFIPKNEGAQYSDRDRMMGVFRSAFQGNTVLGDQYVNWVRLNKGPISEFFEFVYSHTNKTGKGLGNTQPGDGGKYFGRGFIQITGRENYEKYATLSGTDIVNNPELLNTDNGASAYISVLYFQDRVKANVSAHPGYFNAAKKAINAFDNPDKKIRFYEYFYGVNTPASAVNEKSPETSAPTSTRTLSSPAPSLEPVLGFKDPNNKYPLKSFILEPDTNRLARGISTGTIVYKKIEQRAIDIPRAFNKGSYSEPNPAFAARYPFNHVFESEAGHIQEFDDTPGFERTHFYHRKGTFTEVDANGSEVRHIVGDSYHIIDRNGSIYIKGECNITVDGDTNILCRSDANVEVTGDANMKVGGDFNVGVAENMTIAVGGDFSVLSRGNMNLQSRSNLYTQSSGNTNIQASRLAGDAGRIDWNSGASSSGPSIGLAIPTIGSPLNIQLEYLKSPDQDDEVLNQFETEDEWADAPATVLQKLEEKYPETETTAIEEKTPSGGTNDVVPANCNIIESTKEFTADFRLSENFTLGMMFDGGFNKRHKLVAQNGLTVQQIVCNLSQLCQNILEPYLDKLPGGIGGINKEWRISSGYRQGTSRSQHNKGQACDIALSQNTRNRKQATYDLAIELESSVPYDQIILEYRGTSQNWIHTSYNPVSNRKQAFTMLNDKTYPQRGATGFKLL
jgi:predicted chitinase